MKKLKQLGWALCLSLNVWAGNEVGGGGIAENNLLYALANLDSYIEICLNAQNACPLTDPERKLLTQIKSALPEERKNPNLIQFSAESLNPGFFHVDGHVRIAKTGFSVGSPIYFNRDLLYPKLEAVPVGAPSIPNPKRPYDLPFAVSILVHELGHHQGEKDHTYLDSLGSKINSLMQTSAAELDGGPYFPSLIATVLNYEGGSPELLLRDSEKLYSIGEDVTKALVCKADKKPLRYMLWNLHWLKGDETGISDVLRHLRMRAVIQCEEESSARFREVDLEFRTKAYSEVAQGILIEKNSLKIRQIDCAKTPSVCH